MDDDRQQEHALSNGDEDVTIEDEIAARARDGDVDALLAWRELLEPVDYEELGWC